MHIGDCIQEKGWTSRMFRFSCLRCVRTGNQAQATSCCDTFLANCTALPVVSNIKDKCQIAKPFRSLHFSRISTIKSCINVSTTLRVANAETFLSKCATTRSIDISYTYVAFLSFSIQKSRVRNFLSSMFAGNSFGDLNITLSDIHSEQC